jgi:putative membrane protein
MLAAAAVGAVVLGTVPASAAPTDPADTPEPTAPTALSAQDSQFVMAAGYGGNFEVAAGSLARGRGYSQAVQDFGTKMVSDHNKAGTELAQLARANGMSTPDLPDSAQQNILNAWSRLDGLLFDCAYVPAEYLDHVGAIAMFENEAAHGDNADIVAFARETLPTLQEHKRMIAAALTALDCNG